MAAHGWKSFFEDEDRPEKPRRYGVTEMRGPHYTLLSQNLLQDIFESMGHFVDGLKFSGGSHSLMPKAYIKEVTNMAHKHNVYVSTGDWAEHLLQKGPSAFKEYIEECKELGFDTIELNVESLGVSEETLLRFIRLIKSGGLKAKPQFAVKFNKSDIPLTGDRAFGAYVIPVPRTSGIPTPFIVVIALGDMVHTISICFLGQYLDLKISGDICLTTYFLLFKWKQQCELSISFSNRNILHY
ncbi:protein HEAT-STRESS-ASSOCIATED 32 [Actinidia eriantha]|uniref:protein HEAT-STRESS-ASSOCIATED 32 n=1 Tax=Actinidia eriantha TaxID=165200 RepID=UPI002584BCF8|nr:protein HEAT-STRESS-ASSOCIATED 32 [Actinidia eriantha]